MWPSATGSSILVPTTTVRSFQHRTLPASDCNLVSSDSLRLKSRWSIRCCRSDKYGGLEALVPLLAVPSPSSKAEANRLADQLVICAKLEEILDAVNQHRLETREGFCGVSDQLALVCEQLEALQQENARLTAALGSETGNRKRPATEEVILAIYVVLGVAVTCDSLLLVPAWP